MDITNETAEPSGASGGSLAWIPVTERLPEKGCAVLGFRAKYTRWDDNAYGMAWREIDNESTPRLRWNECGRPTHWMPLPAPPTDAK